MPNQVGYDGQVVVFRFYVIKRQERNEPVTRHSREDGNLIRIRFKIYFIKVVFH
jgi:hypothetical protein